MGFWSAMVLARAAPPPVVTVDEIGRFVRAVAAADVLRDSGGLMFRAKYGPRVDADEETTEVADWDETGTVGTHRDYPWDCELCYPSLADMAADLEADRRPVYRARASLGDLRSDLISRISREASAENATPLWLECLSLTVGPVFSAALDSEAPAFVGWMSLELSGPGYFFPWTFREAWERLEAEEAIQKLVQACRTAWPVLPTLPSAEGVENRRQTPDLWLYDDFDRPADWLWFVREG